jgi:SnoaL-like domain
MDPATILDRIEIHELMFRYGMGVDRKDWDLYRSVFTEDAQIDYTDSGGIRAGVDDMIEWLSKALAPFVGLHHNMTNHIVTFENDGARACTYFLAFHTTLDGAGGEVVFAMGGFYQDRLVRTRDEWRIADRNELGVWMEGPYAEGIARPTWYGKQQHHRACLPS